MHIGLDFDGVIADTTHLKLEVADEMGFSVNPNRFKEKLVVEDGIMAREDYRSIMERVCTAMEVGMRMTPCAEAIETIQLLAKSHTLTVITSREGKEVEVADAWCKEQGIPLPFVSVGYGVTKADAACEHGIDVYMDDDLHKLEPLVGIVPRLFLYRTPQNAHEELPEAITRVMSWNAFKETLNAR